MTMEQFLNTIKIKQREFNTLMNRTLPIKEGAEAKAHFEENFIKGGFVNNGLKKWKPANKLSSTRKDAKYRYKILREE